MLLAWTKVNTTTNRNDPSEGDILELAFHITNLEEPWTHRGSVEHRISPGNFDEFKTRMAPEMLDRYEKNGSLELIEHGAHSSIEDVEDDIMDFFGNYGEPGQFLLAGRNLNVERTWLRCWMPELDGWFMDHTLDLDVMSAVIAETGMADDLDPSRHYSWNGRAHNDAEEYCLEFIYYVELLRTIPLREDASH